MMSGARKITAALPAAVLTLALAAVLALAILASGLGGAAWAQTRDCTSTPGAGQTVFCKETDNDTAIDLDLDGVTISTTVQDQETGTGVYAWKDKSNTGDGGTGDIEIDFTNGSITTNFSGADGITAWHQGAGDIVINVRNGSFVTGGDGIDGQGNNNVTIDVRDSSITVSQDNWKGVGGQVDGAGDLAIDIRDTGIQTSGSQTHGVNGFFQTTGNGKLGIRIEGGSIKTSGADAIGVQAIHWGTGGIDIDAVGGSITSGRSHGFYVERYEAAGDIDIDILDGSTVKAAKMGVYGGIRANNGVVAGNIDIDVVGSTISTSGKIPYKDPDEESDGTETPVAWAHGILAERGAGTVADDDEVVDAIDIHVRDSTITTRGNGAYAISAWDQSSPFNEDRHIRIAVRGSTVTTTGDGGRGVYGWRANGSGDILIDVAGSAISTSGETYSNRAARGISAYHEGTAGNVVIAVWNGSRVTTEGANAHGIYARRAGTSAVDDVDVVVRDGSTVATSGAGAHGIYARGNGANGVNVLIRNAAVRAAGAGSHGIRVRGGGLDGDGNRRQTVGVGSEVWGGSGAAAGILLEGGGRIIIGPDGRVGAASGVAIRVTRADPSDTTESPHLDLNLALDGRLPEKVLLGRVVNDNGTTAWTVNGMLLFDDAAGGARNVLVPNGAWDVGATGTSLSTLAFTRVFAPRAAVYEALPGVLLRLDEPGGIGDAGRLRSPGTPVWARIAGGMGSYRADNATVGAEYDFDRYGVETGVDFPLDYGLFEGELTGWAGVRVVSGSADVSAPTGGGTIEARGQGLIAGLAWEGEGDWYGKGRLSLTRYSADLSSAARGGLKSGVSGMVHSLGLEGGRRFGLDLMGVKTTLTARGMLRRSGLSLDGFEDGLFSRVSIEKADRLTAGGGVAAETGLLPENGVDRLVLRGSLDMEQVLSGGTAVDVSDTMLESKAGGTGIGAGFGGAYRMGGYTVGGSVKAGGVGSGDTSYSGGLGLRMAF